MWLGGGGGYGGHEWLQVVMCGYVCLQVVMSG